MKKTKETQKPHWQNKSIENIIAKIDGIVRVERWKDCIVYTESGVKVDFTGYYKVSSFGRIKSLGRDVHLVSHAGNPCIRKTVDKILGGEITVVGYRRVTLVTGGGTERAYAIHRIVMSTFRKYKKEFPQINHENGIKLNNTVWNLKWCTQEYNQQHAYITGLNIPKKSWEDSQSVAVIMYSPKTKIKKIFGSMGEAQKKTGVSRTCIRRSCESSKAIKAGRFIGLKFSYYETSY